VTSPGWSPCWRETRRTRDRAAGALVPARQHVLPSGGGRGGDAPRWGVTRRDAISLDRAGGAGVNAPASSLDKERRDAIARRGASMKRSMVVLGCAVWLAVGASAQGSTLTQNLSWTVDRAGTTTRYRVVAYGDSIYAGYYGSISRAIQRAATTVDSEYLSSKWGTDILNVRRCKSGAVASDIYNNKIVAERSYMQTTDTRVVTFEMCGNDGLQARSSFAGQSGTCNYAPLDTALSNCTTYQQAAMDYINANANANTKLKIVANLYYPGYAADNALAGCTDSGTGQRPNKQQIFLPYIARMNWRACDFARQKGFACADSFAEYMAAEYDSNGDGLIDADAIRYVPGESETAYVNKIVNTYRATLRDANGHLTAPGTSFDYIQSDDTHPTYSGSTIYLGLIGGSGSGSGAPAYGDAQIVGGKNPIWNRNGHDKMGWSLSTYNPAAP
jgi:lysophospholipase L1-like esterase